MTRATPPLELGLIGMSDGNGHPYSWSAIFNGYDPEAMAGCPFPVIPQYLGQHQWPEDFLGAEGSVSHIWTQDRALSRHIARASRIEHVVDDPAQMLGRVDGLLIARDDAEQHLRFAAPFLRAGLPVYVDKPLALGLQPAARLLELEQWPGQVFTCSGVRFAQELVPTPSSLATLGELRELRGSAPKGWKEYGAHAIEPAVALLGREGLLGEATTHSVRSGSGASRRVDARLSTGVCLSFETTGTAGTPITLRLLGSDAEVELTFADSFSAFRSALGTFVRGVRERALMIDRRETLSVVEMLSWGIE